MYAIRFGKWVEIREARYPPTKVDMEAIVLVEGQKVTYKDVKDPYYGGTMKYPVITTCKQKKKLKDVKWEGGDFVTCFPYTRWTWGVRNYGLTGMNDGDIIEVPHKQFGKTDKYFDEMFKTETNKELLLGKIHNQFRGLEGVYDGEDEDDDNYN